MLPSLLHHNSSQHTVSRDASAAGSARILNVRFAPNLCPYGQRLTIPKSGPSLRGTVFLRDRFPSRISDRRHSAAAHFSCSIVQPGDVNDSCGSTSLWYSSGRRALM